MRPAAAAHTAELSAEVVPRVAAAAPEAASAAGDGLARVGAGLRCEQECSAGAKDEPQAEAGGKHTQAELIVLAIGRGGRPEWSGR